MENLMALITESARVLRIPQDSKLFTDATAIAQEALASGMGEDAAHEFARRVLLAGITPALSAA